MTKINIYFSFFKASFNISTKDMIFICIFAVLSLAFLYAYWKNLKSQKHFEGLRKKFENINDDKNQDDFAGDKK